MENSIHHNLSKLSQFFRVTYTFIHTIFFTNKIVLQAQYMQNIEMI